MDSSIYYFNYVTTNLINDKQYVGMHTTKDIDDGYIGSGKALWNAIKKYGKNNFKTEILEFHNDASTAHYYEKEWIIDLDTLTPNGYNICPNGGTVTVKGNVITTNTRELISSKLKGRKLKGKIIDIELFRRKRRINKLAKLDQLGLIPIEYRNRPEKWDDEAKERYINTGYLEKQYLTKEEISIRIKEGINITPEIREELSKRLRDRLRVSNSKWGRPKGSKDTYKRTYTKRKTRIKSEV